MRVDFVFCSGYKRNCASRLVTRWTFLSTTLTLCCLIVCLLPNITVITFKKTGLRRIVRRYSSHDHIHLLRKPRRKNVDREEKNFIQEPCSNNVSNDEPKNEVNTPIKIFIYDLPPQFNRDIVQCFQNSCITLSHCGMGEELDHFPGSGMSPHISVRNTHQFSLEVILHNKLRLSPYRTWNMERADIFYIPSYIGLLCKCPHKTQSAISETINNLYDFLHSQPYFYRKPHLSTIGKIEREMGMSPCALLKHSVASNITFFAIEKEQNEQWREENLVNHNIIVVPYPSYIHYQTAKPIKSTHSSEGQHSPEIHDHRDVFIFLAASSRMSNIYRRNVINQFHIKTEQSYTEFKNHINNIGLNLTQLNTSMVMLVTQECKEKHRRTTVPWMRHSIFCLQPPGDSASRKSFYDSLLSGCIPVLFPDPSNPKNPYAFQRWLKYSSFTVTITYRALKTQSIMSILKQVPNMAIHDMQRQIQTMAQWMQYSVPNGTLHHHDDAMAMIIHEVTDRFNLNIKL